MSALKNEFQTVRLPDIALADMYRQHLVIVEPAAARQQTAMAVSQVRAGACNRIGNACC